MRGYDNMADVCTDLGEVVDILWLSGTRRLLLNLSSHGLESRLIGSGRNCS